MSLAPTKAVEVCHSQYQEIYSEYNRTSRLKIIVSHFGEFSQDLVNSITNSVEETMLSMGDKKGTVKKMFSILVEGLQNIRLHGVRDELDNQSSFVIIAQDEKEYLVTFGNIILNDIWPYIEDKIKQINGYSEEEVKALYMESFTQGKLCTMKHKNTNSDSESSPRKEMSLLKPLNSGRSQHTNVKNSAEPAVVYASFFDSATKIKSRRTESTVLSRATTTSKMLISEFTESSTT